MIKHFSITALSMAAWMLAPVVFAQAKVAASTPIVVPAGVITPPFFNKQGIVVTGFKKGVAGLNVWQVEKGATKTVFYTSADNKVLMSGVLWDADTGSNISDKYINHDMVIPLAAASVPAGAVPASAPTAIKSLALSGVARLAGIKEGNGSVDRTLFVMFDPRCPYCHNVFKKTRQFVANGGTIKWIPTTILGDKANGVKLVADIMQASNPIDAMAKAMLGVGRQTGSATPNSTTAKAVADNEAYFFAAFESNAGAGQAGVPVAFFQTATGPQMVSGIDDDALLKRIFTDIKK
jgi:thiol:disulfide interchange protein DsbG